MRPISSQRRTRRFQPAGHSLPRSRSPGSPTIPMVSIHLRAAVTSKGEKLVGDSLALLDFFEHYGHLLENQAAYSRGMPAPASADCRRGSRDHSVWLGRDRPAGGRRAARRPAQGTRARVASLTACRFAWPTTLSRRCHTRSGLGESRRASRRSSPSRGCTSRHTPWLRPTGRR